MLKAATLTQFIIMSRKKITAALPQFEQEIEAASVYLDQEREYMNEWLEIDPEDPALIERDGALAAVERAVMERNAANQTLRRVFSALQQAEQHGKPERFQADLVGQALEARSHEIQAMLQLKACSWAYELL